MDLDKLINNKEWGTALITFKKENWTHANFNKRDRTYRVTSSQKYFDPNKISNRLFGDCQDGIDLGVRLDLYNWEVESIEIEF